MARIRSTKLQNMRDKSWYTISDKADGPAQVHIYDEIGYVGVSAQQFMSDISGIKGPMDVHLNTPGGEVFDGIAIYNALKQRGNVTVYVDSLAASIGSVIACAGNPTIMAKNSQMMIHDGFGMTVGNAADMREMADLLDKTSDNIASIYAEKTGKPASGWRDAMKTETWMSAQEAVDAGLADQIQGSEINNHFDLSIFKNAGNNNGYVLRDGKWVFDPDNDGDDDSTASGDSDHDYWDPDGNQLKSIPPDPDGKQGKPLPPKQSAKAIRKANAAHPEVYNAGVDTSDWDGGKAMANGAASDNPATFYAAICAGKKAGDPKLQSSWALPYKYTPSSAPNAAGVKNALARISQTEGLTNKAAAQALLEKLMKQVNPDYDPSAKMDAIVNVLRKTLQRGDQ